jgi:hypothetical protein
VVCWTPPFLSWNLKDLFWKKCGQCLYLTSKHTHHVYILSQLYTTALLWFHLKLYTLAGFELGVSCSHAARAL